MAKTALGELAVKEECAVRKLRLRGAGSREINDECKVLCDETSSKIIYISID